MMSRVSPLCIELGSWRLSLCCKELSGYNDFFSFSIILGLSEMTLVLQIELKPRDAVINECSLTTISKQQVDTRKGVVRVKVLKDWYS